MVAMLRELADQLTEAGVPASLERSKTQTPGAWVTPANVDLTTLGGDGTARVHVHLVVADSGDVASLEALSKLLDAVTTGIPPLLIPAEPVDTSWALVIRDTPLPAFRVAVDCDL